MDRNIYKEAERGRGLLSSKRQLTLTEILSMMEVAKNGAKMDIYNAVELAYAFGASVGYRQAVSDRKNRKKA